MRRRRNPSGADVQTLIVVGGVAAAAYLIYQLLNKAPKLVKDATAPAANAIASLWNKLTLGPPMSGVLGDVILPDGGDVGPLAGMQIKTDPAGNVYVNLGGDVYQLGQSDTNGNWPAQLVLDPNFGITGAGW